MKKHIAIILAAGKGTRMKSNIPKQYMTIEEKPVIYYTIKAFEESYMDEIILVTGKDEGSTDNQDAYLELARTQVRHNMSLKELKQKLSEYCINQYEERENLYEQCSDARNLFTMYNGYEYGYSVFDREKEAEIIDPRENEVKSFVTQQKEERRQRSKQRREACYRSSAD